MAGRAGLRSRTAASRRNCATWGKALFDAVFPQREMLRVYDEFRHERRNSESHRHRRDRSAGAAIAVGTAGRRRRLPLHAAPPISIRRRMQKSQTRDRTQPFQLPVRILMVVSRPDGAGFLDPRSSAQALLDAIEPLGDQVIVEFLYPPTLKALTQRVRDPQSAARPRRPLRRARRLRAADRPGLSVVRERRSTRRSWSTPTIWARCSTIPACR